MCNVGMHIFLRSTVRKGYARDSDIETDRPWSNPHFRVSRMETTSTIVSRRAHIAYCPLVRIGGAGGTWSSKIPSSRPTIHLRMNYTFLN